MTRERSARSILIAVILLGTVTAALAQFHVPADSSPASYDCGTQALYFLLRLEGRSVEPARLEAILPPLRPEGHSMRELRDAASAVGLDVRGVRVRLGDRAPDRPILALLHDGPHRHFAVVRPVGHTGRLAQVIDGRRLPEVVDAAALYASPAWSGLALVPRRSNWLVRLGVPLTLVLSIALLLAQLHRRKSPSSRLSCPRAETPNDPPAPSDAATSNRLQAGAILDAVSARGIDYPHHNPVRILSRVAEGRARRRHSNRSTIRGGCWC